MIIDLLQTSICYHTYQNNLKDACKTLQLYTNLCIGAMNSLIFISDLQSTFLFSLPSHCNYCSNISHLH